MKNNLRRRERKNDGSRKLKILLVRGVLFFYILNLSALLIGVIGIKTLGRAAGTGFMLFTIASVQVMAGYVVYRLGPTVAG